MRWVGFRSTRCDAAILRRRRFGRRSKNGSEAPHYEYLVDSETPADLLCGVADLPNFIVTGRGMRFAVVLLGLLFAGTAYAQSSAQPATKARISFTVEQPQLEPAAYSLEIYEDGSGSYRASYTVSATGDSAPEPVERAIQIHDPLLTKTFDEAREHHFFAFDCEGRHARVALTGKKTLAYSGPDGAGSCTFNYSKEQWVDQLARSLQAVAYTLEEGVRLKREERYDRLSLDNELASLQEAVQNGQALEVENIQSELQSIVRDGAVMNRARGRAYRLMAETTLADSYPDK